MREFFEKVIHFFMPSKCIAYLYINNEADLVCSCCGRKIGFVYGWEPAKVFIFEKYIKLKRVIVCFMNLHAERPKDFDENIQANADVMSSMIEKASHFLDDNMITQEISDDELEDELFVDIDEQKNDDVLFNTGTYEGVDE